MKYDRSFDAKVKYRSHYGGYFHLLYTANK